MMGNKRNTGIEKRPITEVGNGDLGIGTADTKWPAMHASSEKLELGR